MTDPLECPMLRLPGLPDNAGSEVVESRRQKGWLVMAGWLMMVGGDSAYVFVCYADV